MANDTLLAEKFGPLQGVKIVSTGTLIAQPFAGELAAEMGAEVIQIERPGIGDIGWRNIGIKLKSKDGAASVATTWIQERRNVFCVTLDLSKPRGRDLFLKLVARADIWMESSKPGTYSKWNLDDAAVWKVNPRLVITHVSGYGQSGDPDYVARPSYDIVGQAVAGMMYQTGFPDPVPPTRAAPWTGDYLTALFAMWSSLAGLTYARSTGKGQAIDVAQYEAIHKTMGGTMLEYFEAGVVRERSGNRAQGFQPLDSFQASDGWIVMGALSDVYKRLLTVIGLDPDDPKWESARTQLESIEGIEFDAILRGWIAERTVKEVVHAMSEGKVPCAPIMTSKDIAEDPQYRAREMHVKWRDEQVGDVKGIGIAPKFSLTPGKIVRGSVPVGHDNDRIYGSLLGLSPDDLSSLRSEKVI
ncbi:MAG: CoA transferase [Candidatus Binatus sp.]|uniref:CaiB/BaiF CoA transferase family protein n=1 Tax=Candidatus Binatus sp. TaxID=2811406 RepID=UPI00271AD2B8|nr:CoA transferase [Candidatus Binatus sp.]MDO8430909.1 CoA transferase [Candidatus Binatus sp.]